MSELKDQIEEKARLAVAQMSSGAASPLDYSKASLSAVEGLLAEAAPFHSELPQEQIKSLVNLLGSYILKVGYDQFGGSFFWNDEHDQPVLVVGEPEYHIAIMAFDKVRGRLSGDESDNIPFFYDGFASRVQNATPGDRVVFV